MTKRIRFLLIALILSLPFWWAVNGLEKNLNDIFFWQEISKNSQVFTAQALLQEQLNNLKPFRDKNVGDLEIDAKSAISVLIDRWGKEKILFEKDSDLQLPIASLTKLMTAEVILENYDLAKEITISKEAVKQEGNFGKLEIGAKLPVDYLLYPLLLESSNDAAYALANDYDGMTERKFVELMRQTAEKLGLQDSFFDNPTGLDPEESKTQLNYSTAQDLVKLTKVLLKQSLIWNILSTQKFDIYGPELINSNELLEEMPGIIGGKTGYTEMAGGCMILVTRAPENSGKIISVVLGTDENGKRFAEMKRLVDWVQSAYKW